MLACVGGLGQIGADCGVLSLSVLVGPTGLLLLISRAYPEETVMHYLLSRYVFPVQLAVSVVAVPPSIL